MDRSNTPESTYSSNPSTMRLQTSISPLVTSEHVLSLGDSDGEGNDVSGRYGA